VHQGSVLRTLLKTSEIKRDIQDNNILLIMIRLIRFFEHLPVMISELPETIAHSCAGLKGDVYR